MPVYKRTKKSGDVLWYYLFPAPGASRADRRNCIEYGFKTKKEAVEAEAVRRVKEQEVYEAAQRGVVTAEVPKTLNQLLEEFFRQHAEPNLGLKTVEGYREGAAKLSPDFLAMPIKEVTPLHCTREWNRLLASGGRNRRTKEPRPMTAKTVRNIAGMVSTAFGRGGKWGFVTLNPVSASDLPKVVKRKKVALTTAQQDLLIGAASGPWCMSAILDLDGATGARRGEVLALRWADLEDGRATIWRSLCQTSRIVDGVRRHDVLTFKPTKTDEIRVVGLPSPVLATLETHRKQQDIFRRQYGSDYRSDLDLIFANPDGTPLRPNSISASISRLFKRLGIPKPKGAALHLLRHTHGSHMLAKGVPLAAVSARLGHSSVRTTAEIYAHAIHGDDDEAVRRWEQYQQENRTRGPVQ
jgi:integrase